MMDSLKSLKIQNNKTKDDMFYNMNSSSLSKQDAYITHKATQPGLEMLALSRDEKRATEGW